MNCVVGTSDVWFQSSVKTPGSGDDETAADDTSSTCSSLPGRGGGGGGRQIEKSFFISVEEVQYKRDVPLPSNYGRQGQRLDRTSPIHILTVNGMKMTIMSKRFLKIRCTIVMVTFQVPKVLGQSRTATWHLHCTTVGAGFTYCVTK